MKESPKNSGALEGQLTAAYVLNGLLEKAKEQSAAENLAHKTAAQDAQNAYEAFNNAMKHIEKARDFVSPTNLHNVLGSGPTKHGEIAEQVEVCVTNARQVIRKLPEIANIDNVPRTGAVDYDINGIPIQSKFYNNAERTLEQGVLEHLSKYPNFASDANLYGYPDKAGIYHIPKDQYETLLQIKNGGYIEGLRGTTQEKIRNSILSLEERTGKDFSEVVRPSISKYSEVQINTVEKNLDGHEESLKEYNKNEIKKIRENEQKELEHAQHISDPSLSEALKASAVSATISAATSAGIKIYSKIKAGKKLSDFSLDDWKDVGIDFAKGGVKGGITGAGIYGLTKLGGYPAPFAGAMMSASVGLASLAIDYKIGKINKSDFASAACSLSVETGLVAVGTAIGQTFIPIPVLGGIIGSAVSKSAIEITKYVMGEKEKELIEDMEKEYQKLYQNLSTQEKAELEKINSFYDKLGGLISGAMDIDINIRFRKSIKLCQFLNIPEKEIIKSTSELDDFMLS